jgi:hypothetical protein
MSVDRIEPAGQQRPRSLSAPLASLRTRRNSDRPGGRAAAIADLAPVRGSCAAADRARRRAGGLPVQVFWLEAELGARI